MKEIIDPNSGAILFKDDEKDPLDKRVKILEKKVFRLTNEVNKLTELVEKLTKQ